jgi:hypothetical protein
MTRALGIDFAARGARPPAAGLALLALGGALAAALGWHYRGVLQEIERVEARLESLQPAGAAPGRAGLKRGASREGAAELMRAQAVLQQLSAPWNDLFAAVEGALGEHVALLGVQPDAAAARVAVTAEARDIGEALWFAQRLSKSGVLAEAFLTGHEARPQGAARPVRFTLSARWRAMEARP